MIIAPTKNHKLRVAIIEDNPIFSSELKMFLDEQQEIESVRTAVSVEEFIQCFRYNSPDVILLDVGLPGMDGISGIVPIKIRHPSVNIIMLTTFSDNDSIFQSLCSGAVGYILKDASLGFMKDAIVMVSQNQSQMSPSIARKVISHFSATKTYNETLTVREQQVVLAIVDGLSYKLIADRLGIKTSTIQTYIKTIYKKLNVHSRTEVINRVK